MQLRCKCDTGKSTVQFFFSARLDIGLPLSTLSISFPFSLHKKFLSLYGDYKKRNPPLMSLLLRKAGIFLDIITSLYLFKKSRKQKLPISVYKHFNVPTIQALQYIGAFAYIE